MLALMILLSLHWTSLTKKRLWHTTAGLEMRSKNLFAPSRGPFLLDDGKERRKRNLLRLRQKEKPPSFLSPRNEAHLGRRGLWSLWLCCRSLVLWFHFSWVIFHLLFDHYNFFFSFFYSSFQTSQNHWREGPIFCEEGALWRDQSSRIVVLTASRASGKSTLVQS